MNNVTAEQYRKIISKGEDLREEDLYEIFLGKTKNSMTLKEINEISFVNFKLPEEIIWCDLVVHNKVLYGRRHPADFTFGEYLDLVEFAKDIPTNLINIMTILWRPVTKISFYNRTKAYLSYKFLISKFKWARVLGFKLLANVKYEIEDYNSLQSMKREDEFQTLPAEIAVYTTTFFLITSQQLLIDSLKSLKGEMDQIASHLTSREFLEKI